MKHIIKTGIFVLLMLLVQGCYTLNQIGTPTAATIEFTNVEKAGGIQHFEHTQSVHHLWWGLKSPADAGVETIVANQVRQFNGSGAVNVKLNYQQTFKDGLLAVITLGIYSPFTLTVEGDVVK